MHDNYRYDIEDIRVIDGDTLEADIKIWENIVMKNINLRLADVDTHEISFVSEDSEEYKLGMEEKEFVENWVSNEDLYILTETPPEDGMYGRPIVRIYRESDNECLNNVLLNEFDNVTYK